MYEAIFGIIGVVVGSGISWFQSYLSSKNERRKNARYLAIRLVCVLDKYLEDCANVVSDNGLSYGQRTEQGCLSPQINSPKAISYPADIDWKSIDYELMYKLLSFPSEIEDGNRMIRATENITIPPDYQEWFDERKFYYCQFGLLALELSEKLSKKYKINKKIYNSWNPAEYFSNELQNVATRRDKRINKIEKVVANFKT